MTKREFLMLAQKLDLRKHDVRGMLLSEKLDGMRAFWDGGVSIGMRKGDIPWANTSEPEHRCTGLWTRYGNVIHAPTWFYCKLPSRIPLDGELFRVGRQGLFSTIKRTVNLRPDDWNSVKYYVFDVVDYHAVFADGVIKSPNFTRRITGVMDWLRETHNFKPERRFDHLTQRLNRVYALQNEIITPLTQTAVKTPQQVEDAVSEIVAKGGEGVILRHPYSYWSPNRSPMMLKYKPFDDDEGVVVGYVGGLGKYQGLIGALILRLANGRTMHLSGFTDAERTPSSVVKCVQYEGQVIPDGECVALQFPLGSVVTFKYRGMSEDGIPLEARYWRRASTT